MLRLRLLLPAICPSRLFMPSIDFLPFAARSSDFPKARLSLLPSLGLAHWLDRPSNHGIRSAFLDEPRFFQLGRYALTEALRRAGAGPGKAVLLPAYHCRTVVESVIHTGAEPRFYPVLRDLRPDYDALPGLLADGAARCMVHTHFFGFAHGLEQSAAFCDEHDLILIEDCAHAFYGSTEGRALGTVGRFATASAWKFFPVPYGAVLRDNGPASSRKPFPTLTLGNEIRGVASMASLFRKSRDDLPEIDVSSLIERARVLVGEKASNDFDVEDPDLFRPELVGVPAPRVYRWVVSSASHNHVTQRRRAHSLRWLEGVRGVPGVVPLYSSLPDDIVPYAFPLIVDPEGILFTTMKLAGIPIWRWEDMAATGVASCQVASDYRLRLLQLPCHQELSFADIDWMIGIVRESARMLNPGESRM